MKKISLATCLLVVSILAGNAVAQSAGDVMANIPFSFTVGDKTLPAGRYVVSHLSGGAMRIWSPGTRNSAIFFAIGVNPHVSVPPQMVFTRYATGESFLRRYCDSQLGVERELLVSPAEKAAKRQSVNLAQVEPETQKLPHTAIIALQTTR